MPEWTDNAKRYWAEALKWLEERENGQGGNGEEFAQDIRLHLETELSQSSITLVTAEILKKRVSAILGFEPLVSDQGNPHASEDEASNLRFRKGRLDTDRTRFGVWRSFWVIGFGVVLPLLAVAFELLTGACASAFFDPVPSWMHALLICLVPLACGWNVLSLKRDREPTRWDFRLLGMAVAVSAYFTVPFAAIMPFAVIGLVFYGLGLLPWAPFLSLLVGLGLVRRWKRLYPDFNAPWKQVGVGLLMGVGAIFTVDAQRVVTKYALNAAANGTREEVAKAVQRLRTFGSEAQMLDACLPDFERNPWSLGWWSGPNVSPEKARELYFRVTGREFHVDADRIAMRAAGLEANLFRNRWDWYRGDQVIGRKVEGLRLEFTRLDGAVDGDAGHGYLEWTMEFANDSLGQAEARALVQLPSGGAVSRVNLWIDGEPREAAFSAKRKVVEAYRKVVQRRRDPVLVTTKGRDRVFVQCFPVPAKGKMKIRIGVVYPLSFDSPADARFAMPTIAASNFAIAEELEVPIWIESKTSIHGATLGAEIPGADIRRTVPFATFQDGTHVVHVARDPGVETFWSVNPYSGGVVQAYVMQEETLLADKRWIVVLDSSVGVGRHREGLWSALRANRDRVDTILVADEIERVREFANLDTLVWIASGGQDNAPALEEAFRKCEGRDDVAILWIHGAQSRQLSSLEGLHRQLGRRRNAAPVFTLAYEPGMNVLLSALEMELDTKPIPNGLESAGDDLRRFFELAKPGAKSLVVRYELVNGAASGTGPKASDHAARLWALAEAKRIFYERKKDAYDRSAQFAATHQLVTPVSGAVVLENQEQYDEAGLEPVKTGTTSSIPDGGGTAALLAIGVLAMAVVRIRFVRSAR